RAPWRNEEEENRKPNIKSTTEKKTSLLRWPKIMQQQSENRVLQGFQPVKAPGEHPICVASGRPARVNEGANVAAAGWRHRHEIRHPPGARSHRTCGVDPAL
ncbi:MAG: hypothetical protein AAF674_08475, partial [Pseudomonadota bacterium]